MADYTPELSISAPRVRRGRIKRLLAAVLALSVASILPTLSSSQPVSAATEIDWYVAVPGYVRTNLQPSHVVALPGDDVFYAVTDGGTDRWTLMMISVDDFSVLHETEVTGHGAILDIEVSAAGIVYVLTASSVSRFRATDLSLVQRITLATDDPRNMLSVAHDRPDRFALIDPNVFTHSIYTGTSRVRLDGLGLDNIGLVGFGTDSDDVLGVDTLRGGPTAGFVATFDISASPSLTAITDDWMWGLMDVADDVEVRGVGTDFLVTSRADGGVGFARVDGATLVVTFGRAFAGDRSASRPVAIDYDAGQVFTTDSIQRSMTRADVFDVTVDPVAWSFPVTGSVTVLAALGDGIVAGLERGDSGRQYLVIASSNYLGGGFGDYHAVVPDRLLDTRHAIGVPQERRMQPGQTITVEVAGRGGLPDEGILAVTMNATITEPSGSGFIKVWPSGVARPEVSNVNYVRGKTVANSVTVTVGGDGNLQLYNHTESAAHVLLDITGYYSDVDGPQGSRYFSNGLPQRLLDTRYDWYGPKRRLGPGDHIDVVIPATSDSIAAALNITAVGGTAFSFLSVYPADLPVRPETSTLNYYAGDIRSNSVIATLPTNNTVRIYNHEGTVDVVVDLFGHYVTKRSEVADQEGRYYPTNPYRRFDSREDSPFPGSGALEPDSLLILGNSAGWTDILNVTVTEPTQAGYLAMLGWSEFQTLSELPETSNVNFVANETIANAVYATGAPLNALFNPLGYTHVVIDVFGFLTPEQLSSIDDAFGGVAGALSAPDTATSADTITGFGDPGVAMFTR